MVVLEESVPEFERSFDVAAGESSSCIVYSPLVRKESNVDATLVLRQCEQEKQLCRGPFVNVYTFPDLISSRRFRLSLELLPCLYNLSPIFMK